MSNSILTTLFFFKFFKLVNFNVCGIMLISNDLFLTPEIVNETPLIEIEAFSRQNLGNKFFS